VRIGNTVFKVQLLKHVQAHSPTSWHELTRIDMKVPLQSESPVSLSVMEQRSSALVANVSNAGPRWKNLLDRPQGMKLSRGQGLTLMVIGGVALVFLAIFAKV
jgi:hypothetical protein